MVNSEHQPGGQAPSDKGQVPETVAAPFSFRVGFYVDGFNLYHAVDKLREPGLKWLNLRSLAQSYLRPGDRLERIAFFTAFNTWDQGKRQRHVQYANALEATGVEVIRSRFDRNDNFCKRFTRWCPFHEEKQTDTGIAVSILSDCFDNVVNRVFLVSADSDHVPLAKKIRTRFSGTRLFLVAPPGRLTQARELGQHVHRVFELTPGRLRQHRLPANVENERGRVKARRPSAYGPHD